MKNKTNLQNILAEIELERVSVRVPDIKKVDYTLDDVYKRLTKVERSYPKLSITLDNKISSVKKEINEYQEAENTAKLSAIEKSLIDIISNLEKKLTAPIKPHKDHSGDIESLRHEAQNSRDAIKQSNNLIELLKGDVNKYSKDIYEYGAQLQVLSNGALVGTTSQVNFTSGLTVTVNKIGGIDISAGGGNSVFNEIVAGSATTFTLARTPRPGTQLIHGNGYRLTPGAGNDYTISGTIITIVNGTYSAGAVLADYQY